MTLPDSVLIANRGEIARRIIATCRRLGIRAIAVHSEADAELPFVSEADEAHLIGPAAPASSYLDADAVLAVARQSGAAAIHPGYGFLSESEAFAMRVGESGLLWVGPPPKAMSAMSDKVDARNTMAAAGVPVLPGTPEPLHDVEQAILAAAGIGYPVMVKASAGGGGIGMAVAHDEDGLRAAFETARTRAERFFSSPAILLERYIARARHIEVQILGLADGSVVALGERDCSVQRRHQKVAEETPSPAVDDQLRANLLAVATKAGEAVGYRNAGTVEMLLDVETGEAYFLEMNTRLQVEHPITEMVTGLDLVEEQLRIAAGLPPTWGSGPPPPPSGHAIEFRVYAEDPVRFLPGPGTITEWTQPQGPGIRVDAGYRDGNVVTPFYDPLMAKLVVHGRDRAEAIERARGAVGSFTVTGPKVNLPLFTRLLDSPAFVAGDYDTGILGTL